MHRMGSLPILSLNINVPVGTVLKFDTNAAGKWERTVYGDGNVNGCIAMVEGSLHAFAFANSA